MDTEATGKNGLENGITLGSPCLKPNTVYQRKGSTEQVRLPSGDVPWGQGKSKTIQITIVVLVCYLNLCLLVGNPYIEEELIYHPTQLLHLWFLY